jgi:hypothetical protein
MKQLIKSGMMSLIGLLFKVRFRWLIRDTKKNSSIYLIDIDNTLANTWPSLKDYVYKSENYRYRSLPIFIGMRNFINDRVRRNTKVIFISARSYFNYYATARWLFDNGLPGHQLILVPNADSKLDYIIELLYRSINVVYVDDLSHSHELGTVELYEDLILGLKELPIQYLGINEIALINSDYEINN